VLGTEISKSLCLAFPLTPDELPFDTEEEGGRSGLCSAMVHFLYKLSSV